MKRMTIPDCLDIDTGERVKLVQATAVVNGVVCQVWLLPEEAKKGDQPIMTPPEKDGQ